MKFDQTGPWGRRTMIRRNKQTIFICLKTARFLRQCTGHEIVFFTAFVQKNFRCVCVCVCARACVRAF